MVSGRVIPLRTREALHRRPRRAKWTPWRRTVVMCAVVAVAAVAVVAFIVWRGIVAR